MRVHCLLPQLFCLRREYRHLMKHVRCVYIKTVFGHFPTRYYGYTPFRVPETLQDWYVSRNCIQEVPY